MVTRWRRSRKQNPLIKLCARPVRSRPGPGAEPSGGGADHLHGGPAHVHAAVRVRGELPGIRLRRGAGQLLPPAVALLLADPQQRPVRLPAQSRQTRLGVARLPQVRLLLVFIADFLTSRSGMSLV